MDKYEKTVEQIEKEVMVVECDLSGVDAKGYYMYGFIFIDKNLTSQQKLEILVEEYGHFKTSVGTILNRKISTEAQKQEVRARNYGIEYLISLEALKECSSNEYDSNYEYAEFLDVSEEFLKETVAHYATKYDIVAWQ